jgi:hypothetical protein
MDAIAWQILQLVFTGLLVPAVYGILRKMFEIERRLSHIEGKLGVVPRGD